MNLRLEEASHAGDLAALHCLLQEDRLLLHKLSAATPSVANNPLHIAALLGHADFVREVLRLTPDLAQDTNVDGLTSLHLASARGHLPVVMELISTPAGSDLCRIRDSDGLLPIHTAASKGRVHVLQALLEKSPELFEKLLSGGDTILHCAVKSGCHEAVQILVERMNTNQASILLNSKDERGNTILHLAAARGQLQTIKMLLTKPEMKVNELNTGGFTPLDVLLESPNQNALANMIMSAGGKKAGEVHPQQPVLSIPGLRESHISRSESRFHKWLRMTHRGIRWLGLTPASELENSKEEPANSSALIVVATLIATITFQPILSPPGGFDSTTGDATRGENLKKFLLFDIIGLFSSLSIILLLMCIEPHRKQKFMKILVWVMWAAAYSTALAFTSAAFIVFPISEAAVTYAVYIWYAIFGITLLWVYLRFTIYSFVMVGWWEMNSLERQIRSKYGLLTTRACVLILLFVIPWTARSGPGKFVGIVFAQQLSSSRNNNGHPHAFIILFRCWTGFFELPLVYICFWFAQWHDNHSQGSSFMKRLPRLILMVAVGFAVGIHVRYITTGRNVTAAL